MLVNIDRVAGFKGDITVSLTSPPDGITASSVVVAGADSAGLVSVHLDAAVTQNAGVVLTVTATAGSLSHSATGTLVIRGRPGTLDTSFVSTGEVLVSIGSDELQPLFLGTDSTGRFVLAGADASAGAFAAARLEPDGSLDSTFNSGGTVTTTFGANQALGQAGAIGPADKIIVAGRLAVPGPINEFAMVRYNVDGSLDATFGSGGRVTTAIPAATSSAIEAVTIQSSGSVLVAGQSDGQLAIARYTAAGVLDAAFGTGGVTLTTVGTAASARALLIQNDGKAVVVGSATLAGLVNIVVARYLANGSLDASFGPAGYVAVNVSGFDDSVTSGLLQSDGRILVAATVATGGLAEYLRLNTDGSVDNSFGINGVSAVSLGGEPIAMAQLPDGRLVAVGEDTNSPSGLPASDIELLLPSGFPDTSWSPNGFVTPANDYLAVQLSGVIVTPDGKLIVSGAAAVPGTATVPAHYAFMLSRYWL